MSIGPLVDPVARAVERALDGVSLRQQVIADNLANASTPGYRAREVQFESQLAAAMDSGRAPETVQPAIAVSDSPVKADGNSVDVTEQAMALDATQLQFEALVSALNFRHNIIRDGLSR